MCRTTCTAAASWLCSAGAGQAARAGERLQPGRHLPRGVRVHGARAAVVPGVQRREQVADLGAADLADDQPVRAHPQGLADQVAQGHPAGALDVRRAGDQAHDVRVPRPQLLGVLDHDDALPRVDGAEQRAEDRRLARCRCRRTTSSASRAASTARRRASPVRSRAPASAQRRQVVRRGPQDAQRQARAVGGDRREDRVQAHPDVGQPAVDARARVVQAPARGEREPLGEAAHRRLVGEAHAGRARARTRGRPTPRRRR